MLFLALLVKAAVPAGYMVAPSAAGWPALILCSGTSPAQGGHHDHGQDRRGQESPCPFTALAAAALPPLPVALPPRTPPAPDRAAPPRRTAPVVASTAPRPPARAPPRFV